MNVGRHLLVGGTGFVGRYVARALVARGEQVVVAGRKPPSSGERPLDVPFVELSIENADWLQILAEFDVIHHYAWASIPATAQADPVGDLDRHVRSSLELLEAAKALAGKRLIFASSGGTVYGHLAHVPTKETDVPRPLGIYGAAKLAVENYMRVYHHLGFVDCRVARLSNPYGTGTRVRTDQGLLSIFTRRALLGEPLTVWGDGEIVRDYVHVSDAADALCRLATAPLEQGGDMPIFNVGSGIGISINQVIRILESQLLRPLNPRYVESRKYDLPISVLDPSKALALLGWSPTVTVEQGMMMLVTELRAALAEPEGAEPA